MCGATNHLHHSPAVALLLLLHQVREMCPGWDQAWSTQKRVVFIDAKLGTDWVPAAVPGSIALLCQWHMMLEVEAKCGPAFKSAAEFIRHKFLKPRNQEMLEQDYQAFERACATGMYHMELNESRGVRT